MNRFVRSTLAPASYAFVATACLNAPALAHPHIFAEASLEVVVAADATLESLRHVWRFDDLFSSTVLLEFDANSDLVLSHEELEAVASVIHESLGEFDYFQFVSADDKSVEMRAPDRIVALFDDHQLTILFESGPASPLPLQGKLEFGVYDPTFYTAIDFYQDENLTVLNLPETCTTQVVRPDPDEAIAMNQQSLTDAFFNDPMGVDYSKLFATRLELNCPTKGVKS